MNGLVQKRHFLAIAKAFGLRKALRILISRQPVALLELMA